MRAGAADVRYRVDEPAKRRTAAPALEKVPEPIVGAKPIGQSLAILVLWSMAHTSPSTAPCLPFIADLGVGAMLGLNSHVFWPKTRTVQLPTHEDVLVLGARRIPLSALSRVDQYGSKREGPAVLIVWWRGEQGRESTNAGFFAADELRVFAATLRERAGIDEGSTGGVSAPKRDVVATFVGTVILAELVLLAMSSGALWSPAGPLLVGLAAAVVTFVLRGAWGEELS